MIIFMRSCNNFGDIVLVWKDYVNIKIISSSTSFISTMILNDSPSTPWQLTGGYGPINLFF